MYETVEEPVAPTTYKGVTEGGAGLGGRDGSA
jgi:hypothetical protein